MNLNKRICFSGPELSLIESLGVEFSYSKGGHNKDLYWGIDEDGEIYAMLHYEARDVDGDWGFACSYKFNISFAQLIEIIKNPSQYFDIRSWN